MPVSPPSPSPSGNDAADRALDARPADDPVADGRPPAPGRPKRCRGLAWAAGILAALVLLAAGGLAGLWVWSGSDQSLATLLRQAPRYLPAGQTLEAQDVAGSLRRGGRIGRLRWQNESLAVELRGIDIGWRLRPLLQRRVQFGMVRIAEIDAVRTGPAKESEPTQPLQGLTLPVQVDVPFQVGRIRWAGPPETVATGLAGRYRYDGGDHRLDIDGVDVANGPHDVRLDARMRLQGAAPMALDAAVNARIATPVPGGEARLTVLAGATAKGTLATEAARLAVAAQVRPQEAQADPAPPAAGGRSVPAAGAQDAAGAADAMQAALEATIAPWLPQPVLQADARIRALDVARLYPDLPRTLLDGRVTVLPMAPAAVAPAAGAAAAPPPPSPADPASTAATAWQIDADLRNALPGPWDRQRLPVESVKGRATFDGRIWDVPGMVVALGGGTIDLAGRFGGADAAAASAPAPSASPQGAATAESPVAGSAAPPAVWQGRATLARISPAALHTQLDPTPIGGTLSAQTAGPAIDFEVALQPDGTAPAAPRTAVAAAAPRRAGRTAASAAAPSPVQALRLRSATAEGRWDRQVLDLRALRVRTQDADLQGQLRVQTDAQSGSGRLALVLPGGQASVEGAMAPTTGQGDAVLRIDDASRIVAWLRSLPGLSESLAGTAVQGAARLDARWDGGWKSVQQRLETGALPAGARDLALQATLAAPRLDARLAPAAPRTARASQAAGSAAAPVAQDGSGAPMAVEVRDLRAELSGTLRQMELSLRGDARADGRRVSLQTRGSGGMDSLNQFRAALASLSLRAEDPVVGGPWTLQLGAPLTATVRTGPAPAASRADARAGAPASTPARRLEIDAGAGRATLAGPAPGTLSIDWDPVRYLQDGAARRLRSAGRLQGLPMAWIDALSASGASALQEYGIQGNLVFDGDWDIDAGDSLRAKARLARRSGDLRVQTGGEAVITRVESSGPTVTSAPAGAGTATAPTAPGSAAVANPVAPKVAAAPSARSATPEPTTSAGLRAASVEIEAQGDAVAARIDWDSERAGQVRGEVRSRIAREGGGWGWPADAPLAGTIKASMPRIGIWSVLAPPGWRVQGTLDADIAIAGTRTAPQWSGTLRADDLGVRSVVDGIELRDGRLRAALRGTRLDIEEFRIAGARGGSNRIAGYSGSRTNEAGTDGGLLTARGSVAWEPAPAAGGSGMRMDIQAQARALRLSARSDRQMTLSGDLRTRLEDGRLVVRGALRTDRAVIILPDESTPSLGSDVVVRSAAKDREAAEQAARAAARDREAAASPAPQTAKPPDILVSFDLGDDFAVQGYGLTTQLTGKVDVRSDRGLAAGPQVTGEIRTARGRYRAYGQQLDIETGIVRFIGPYDNPTLDILALRPNITVRAGVRVTGTALSPQVRLYSEPAMTDAETLSWVVLGRSTANGGAEAALLQQAALAFLSGSGSGPTGGFASKLGLDEVGFKGPGSGADAASAALTFGKRLSRNLYVTYERSLSGTLGTLYIFYDLTRRFTLRGQAGVKSGLDLIYTLPYE